MSGVTITDGRIEFISPCDLLVVDPPKDGATQDGYGERLPTRFRIYHDGNWYAVRAICWGNSASLYIVVRNKKKIFINDMAIFEAERRKS